METMDQLMAKHPFFAGLAPEYLELLAGCARNYRFDAGEYLIREGDPADTFYLIRHGRVTLEIAAPGSAPVVISTLGESEIVGASWIVPPYRAEFDARAMDLTRAIGIDAKCLRGKCDADHHLGYEMMQRFLPIIVKRLHATRLQILDVYGSK
ncbi:cyclic nucleotide-binding domain-containing protein [Novosphingobium mangrovi (ex Huang et al. 2023)]|uniref:Cyclic nucleotide-binding domain-containing protein n=1 Tax=Novosphingobium mangrovi (ex Huang et al. 2023) TaxID=2976432 RepID=A0ABT2I0L2_9SPHN|nr:cyclic nucleotide-binding domain-containing protein [Novosphingobium mangrovi (ex Huang et al. 2023)]MCT2398342.1 cyclic nucleotide-binding domain-containing protein [Novosphingobium mangrovi (ex Huang et al. 2023)]